MASARSRSTTRAAIVRTAAATALGSAPGLLLPLVVVHLRQSRLSTDAYFFSVESALFAATIFTIALKTAVVPFFVEWRSAITGRQLVVRSTHLALQAAFYTLLVYSAVAGLVAAAYLPLSDLPEEQTSQIQLLLLTLAPLPALMAASSVLAGAHYSVDRWSFASWSESLRAVAPLVLLVGGLVDERLILLTLAMSAGEALRLAVLALTWVNVNGSTPVPRAWRFTQVRRLSPEWLRPSATTRAVWLLALPQVASMLVINLNPLIDKFFAAGLSKGSITTLTLAEKLFFVPQTLLASAVALVLGTRWARMSMDGTPEPLRRDFFRWQTLAACAGLVGVVFAGLLTLGLSKPATAFLNVDHETFAVTFLVFVLGLPAALSAAISLRMYVALRFTRPLLWFAIALVVVNVAFDYVGSKLWGVEGLAAASTAVRCVSAAMYFAVLPLALRNFGRMRQLAPKTITAA